MNARDWIGLRKVWLESKGSFPRYLRVRERNYVNKCKRGLNALNATSLFFTAGQVDEMERRTDLIKAHSFAFERKVTVSGRSLSINIPEDLARHLHVLKGKAVRLIPLDDKRFMVETIS